MKKEIEFIDLDVDEIVFTEHNDLEEDVKGEKAYSTDFAEEDVYEEDEYDDEEYEEEEDAYYEDEEYAEDGEYYEDEEEYDEDGEYYEEEDEYDEDEYYDEDEDFEDEDDEEYQENGQRSRHAQGGITNKRKKKKKKKGKILEFASHSPKKKKSNGKKSFFKDFNMIDAIVAGTGVFVLIVAVATMVIWGNSKEVAKQVTSMADVGQRLSNLEVIGESNLLAIADAKKAFGTIQEETPETEEIEDEKGDREVTVNLTSVEKDLKIKFIGKDSKKLIAGTEFEVELTDPDKKTETITDNDKDGIIYKTKMTPGTYSVKILPKDGYLFPTAATSVKVKDKIDYQKIEIADEVKSESEVNVAKEDTAKPVVEESKLKDTIEFVESTKTPIDGTAEYQEIDKSKITDPSATSRAGDYTKFADYSLTVGGSQGVSATIPEGASEISWSSSASSVAEVSGSGGSATVTAKGVGDATITVTWKNPDGSTEPTGEKKFTVTVAAKTVTVAATGLTLDSPSAALTAGGSLKLTAKLAPENTTDTLGAVTYTSSAGNIATVDASGKITAVAAGTATITATANNFSAPCTVTVEANKVAATGLTLNQASATLIAGDNLKLTAKLAPTDTTDTMGAVTYTSSAGNIATVDASSGIITAVAAGTATITATANSFSATCTVTVTAKIIAATGVTVEPSAKTLNLGESVQLKANVAPAGCTDAVSWASDKTAVATVDDSGKVTAVGKGTANITVTVGSKTARCTVTVNTTLKVTLDKTTVEIMRKNTVELKPTATGFSATPTYTWGTSDAKIATVDAAGKVTAVAKGKAKITVTAKDSDGKTAAAACEIIVKTGKEDDKTTKLKDKDGNQLYVKENNAYREAVYADYYTAKAFYKRNNVGYKYTGWQTIDNKTYYFDKNGNKVTGTQVIKGVQYNFGSDGSISMGNGTMGIDVSKWNGTINWTAVRNSGVSYAIIRCGYRGSSTGALIQDPKFQANIKGAQAAGIKVGVYFFTQAVNEVEAVEEASMVLNLIKGNNISYPVFIDTEGSGGRADGIDAGTRTAVCNAFCATIQNGGYKAGIYASKAWFEKKLNTSALSGYKIWLAQYATKPTYGGRYDLWQYTSKGAVGGINGNVDLNTSYLGY